MRRRFLLAIIFLVFATTQWAVAQDQIDPYAAAMQAYRAKDYAAYLENLRKVIQRLPDNPSVLVLQARAYALNGMPEESIAVLRRLASMGSVADLAHADLAGLRERPELMQLRTDFDRNNTGTRRSRIAFTLPERDLIAEGMAYDEQTRTFYVGSIYKRKIVRIKRNGQIDDFIASRQDGIQDVLGMKADVRRRLLWVCAVSGPRDKEGEGAAAVYKYDLNSGKLIKKYHSSDATLKYLFNDIVIGRSGDVFLTDSLGGGVWVIRQQNDALETFIDRSTFDYPNGIAFSDGGQYLLVADARGIHRIELRNREVRPVAHADTISLAGIDGLYWHKGELLGVQNSFKPERIVRIELNKSLDHAEKLTVMEANNALFNIPTTGAIARGAFYYIANSQLSAMNEKGEIPYPEKMTPTQILLVPLD